MRFKDKTVLITGAASGIGNATAIAFARQGANVVVVDMNSKMGKETIKMIRSIKSNCVFVKADIRRESDASRAVRTAVEKYWRIDVLFNNAGVSQRVMPITELSEAEWDRVVDTNLKSIFFMAKHTVPYMKKAGGGVIINTASAVGLVGMPDVASYCASKGGVITLTKSLALELAGSRIRVNCICPGVVKTPNVERLIAEAPNPSLFEKSLRAVHPLNRFAEPEEIANAVLYLASEEASFITGSSLVIDGGWTAH